MHKVAVYGSLRQGMGNYNALLPGKEPIETRTLDGYEMYDVAGGGFPGVVHGEGTVLVEVYEVNDMELSRLDMLEGYRANSPESSFYIREELDDGTFIYIYNERGLVSNYTRVVDGDWVKYREALYA